MPLIYDKEFRVYWFPCGSDNNNAYLVVCPETGESLIIDAPLGPDELLEEAKNTQVKAVLITHSHRDHVEGLQAVMEATGAPMGANVEDAAELPTLPSLLIKDGDRVRAGTVEAKVLHTPGHTPGSVCFLVGNHLFSGDTLFAGGVGKSSSVEEIQQTYKSITEKLYVLPDETFLLPGHGKGGWLGIEKEAYRAILAQYPDLLPPIPDTPPST